MKAAKIGCFVLGLVASVPAMPAYASDRFPVDDARVIYQSLDTVCRNGEDGTPETDAACTVERKVAGILRADGFCEYNGSWEQCVSN